LRLTIKNKTHQIDSIEDVNLIRNELDQYDPEAFTFLKEWFSDSNSFRVSTSGSTGIPKKITLEKWQLKESAKITNKRFGLNESTCFIHCLPTKFIAGIMMWIRCIEANAEIFLLPATSDPLVNLEIPKNSFIALTPNQVQNTLKSSPTAFEKIESCIIGGASCDAELIKALQTVKTKCYSTYGMTETITHCAIKSLNYPYQGFYEVLEGFTINTNEIGAITIEAKHIPNLQITTNDFGKILSENQFYWLGRLDFVINSGGVKVSPEQIEERIAPYISGGFLIHKIKNDQYGERPILIIESSSEIKFHLIQAELSKIECPDEVYIMEKLVQTENGKINRNASFEKANFAYHFPRT